MKTYKKISILAILTLVFATMLFSAPNVLAAAPTLTLSSASDGDSVQFTVAGSANSSVIFYYTKVGYGLQANYLGKTDSNGNFSTSLSTAAYGISGDTVVYITVNGEKSNESSWPYLAAASVLSLSQTSVVLPLGQSTTLTVYNNGTNFVYLASNSNPPVVNVNIDGNKITLKAFNFGSSIVNVCAGIGTPSCASTYVTVQNTGGEAIAFSQNNPTVAVNKNVDVSVIGGTGAYILLNNVNADIIQASLSASTVTLSTTNSSGSSAITICSSDMSSCGIINAVVGNVSSTGLTFSQTNPTMIIGQNLSITISGGAGGDYSVFSNTNTEAVSANISDSNLILVAKAGGVATVTVCSSMGNCAGEVVTVKYNTATGGSLSLSQNNLWLLAGQSSAITVSGGSLPYSAVGYSEDILKASFNNNILTITGVSSGSATVNVCSAGGCIGLAVLVTGTSANTDANAVPALSLSQTSLALSVGNTGKILISGNGGYSLASNSNSGAASAALNGTTVTVTALSAGNTNISICQSGGQCKTVSVTVTAAVQPAVESGWIFCADEKGSCSFSGYQTVRYGANGKYYYSSYLNGVGCNNSVLGDPIVNVVKQCYYGGTIPADDDTAGSVAGETDSNAAAGWASCADEKGICSFSGTKTVRYGANGKYYYGTYSGSVSCSNSVFGDPIENVVKQCVYGGVIPEGALIAHYQFKKTLVYGSSGNEVKELQQRLKNEGFYSGAIDGKFLASTLAAVKAYQKSQGIIQTGNVGPLTMAALNK